MKLFTIYIRHVGSKDFIDAQVGQFLAKSEEVIYQFIAKDLSSGTWLDKENDSPVFSETVNKQEGFKEKMLRIRGDFFDEYQDYSDRYYGLKFFGWNEGIEVTQVEIDTLVKLNIVKVLN